MSWLARLPGPEPIAPVAPSRPDRILPTDKRINCSCGSEWPLFTFYSLDDLAVRDGKEIIREQGTGYRVGCQSCGLVFSIGPNGRFRQDKSAQPPWKDSSTVQQSPGATQQQKPEEMPLPFRIPATRPEI